MQNQLRNSQPIFFNFRQLRGSNRQSHLVKAWLRFAPIVVLLLLTACSKETLFSSNFDATPVGQPPTAMQAVGTAAIDGSGVTVIDPPVTPSGKWIQVSRPNGPNVTGFQGKFSQSKGDGEYTFSTTMFMTPNSGVATIQFETFTNPVSNLQSFMHLDFVETNQVRIDDDEATKFGSFPRNQPFIVQVTVNINASSSTAHIILSGAGASGERDHTIASPFQSASRQFGALRIWQGFPHVGAFDATNIAVTRKTN